VQEGENEIVQKTTADQAVEKKCEPMSAALFRVQTVERCFERLFDPILDDEISDYSTHYSCFSVT
jgi:hypothetical protein